MDSSHQTLLHIAKCLFVDQEESLGASASQHNDSSAGRLLLSILEETAQERGLPNIRGKCLLTFSAPEEHQLRPSSGFKLPLLSSGSS